MPAGAKESGITHRKAAAADTIGPGLRNQTYLARRDRYYRYAHRMRNAGDRVPSGTSGRRHRAADAEDQPQTPDTGGASLFTPAYRASHAAPGGYSSEAARPSADRGQAVPAAEPGRPAPRPHWAGSDAPAGAGWAEQDQRTAGYGWADADQHDIGYGPADPGYGAPDPGYGPPGYDQVSTGYGEIDDRSSAGYSWAGDDLTGTGYSWSRPDEPPPAAPAPTNAMRGFPPAPGDPLPVYPPGPFAAWNRGAAAGAVATEPRPAGYADSAPPLATATITPTEFDTDYSLPAIKDPVLGSQDGGRADPRSVRQPPAPSRGRAGGSHASRSHQAHPAKPRPRGRQHSVRLAIGAAVVMIVAVTVVLVASLGGAPAHQHGASGPTSTPGAATPPTSPPTGKWEFIGTRATDPVPLSSPELFPASFVSVGISYSRAATTGGKSCHAALIGATLQTAVRSAGCTQEFRATYLSKTAKVMATIGVFNLKSFASASKAAAATGHSQFVAQLPAKTGPTRHIGSGTGIEEALVKGHYLILVWAEFLKLHAPKTTAQRQQLETFMNLLITKTANVSLSYRMVDGQPTPPG